MKTLVLVFSFAGLPALHSQVAVFDASVFGQVIKDVQIATDQLQELQGLVERLGDPGDVQLQPAVALMRSLGRLGVGVGLDDLQEAASGTDAVLYHAHGLYMPVQKVITTADGTEFPRDLDVYRKFDAIPRARSAMEDVMADTAKRRQRIRDQMLVTTAQVQISDNFAEIAKLHAVLTAQGAELAAIDRERDAAIDRVLAQQIENSTDAAKQEVARREERMVDFQVATQKLAEFLTPDTTPVQIPDPNQPRL
ncbi:MAG: hypothetical protein H7A46_16985 [Verrucomicrobiales bacterium]|nr:hypothetical protein [Verrucomicrobiales bacterium]